MNPKKNQLVFFSFVLPFLLIFLIFLGLPFFYALYLSFTKVTNLQDILAGLRFVGFKNYLEILRDVSFWWGIGISLYYALLGIPLGIVTSLILALLFRKKTRVFSFYRALIFLPFVLDAFVVGIVWTFIYAPKYGVLSFILSKLHIVSPDFGILSNPITALPGVVFAMTLKNAGFGMILFIAAIDNIPKEVLEAAEIDGATGLRKVREIIVPLLKPVVLFLVITGIIGALSAFAEFYAMTGGGPTITFKGHPVGATKVSGLYLFEKFSNLNLGLAAATSFLLLLFALSISFFSFKMLEKKR